MKNYNKKVVEFTFLTTFMLLLYSIYISVSGNNVLSLNNISIVSDVLLETKLPTKNSINDYDSTSFTNDSNNNGDTSLKEVIKDPVIIEKAVAKYLTAKELISFNNDSNSAALPKFMQKLLSISRGNKKKVRIAWLGDSIIEGDLLTKSFRKRIQQYFGGFGVGFVPATSITASFRNTVLHKWKGDWKEESFKSNSLKAPLFFSGHTFYTKNGTIILSDKTIFDTIQPIEKSLLCGKATGEIQISVNGQTKQYKATKLFNRLILDSSTEHEISVTIQDDNIPIYGISSEPQSGIVVDNFSFRGITGLELGKLDSNFLGNVNEENNYDLVVLEYGANLMFRPNDVDYSWYRSHIMKVVNKLRKAMPNSEFLIISTSDRAFRYEETWKTAVGMNNLLKAQAELAINNNAAFFNMYASMGGWGTIVNWADNIPSLANKDYIHPNFLGAEKLGNLLFDAFMKDYKKVCKDSM